MTSPRPAALESPLVVASNRGPVSFQRNEEGVLIGERGSGGLVTALAGVLFESDATWLAAAMTDGDHEVAAVGSPHRCRARGSRGVRRCPERALRRLLQRRVEPRALATAPLPVRPVVPAVVGRGVATDLGRLPRGQPPLRAGARSTSRSRARLPRAGLSAVDGAGVASRAATRGAHRALHAHPVRRPRVHAGPARARSEKICCAACSAPTSSVSKPSSGRRTSC